LPNNPQLFEVTGWIDRRQGRWPDAVRNFERASELDPRNFFLARYLAGTYFTVRAYDQTSKALGRAYALNPDDIGNRIDRGGELEMHWRADTRRWHATIEKILADDPASAEDQLMREERFRLALFERDFAAADRATAALPNKNPFGDGFSRSFWVGLAARTKGDMAAAQAAFTAARAEQEAEIRARPNDASLLSGLGVIDAALGRKEEALREGRRAVEVVPVADKSLEVPSRVANLAWICAWIGERDLAIEKLEIAVGEIPAGATYGELRLNPIWDSLRDDPRFEKIVASLAPK